MEQIQVDRMVKAIVDGVADYAEITKQADVDPVELVEHAEFLDRAIQLMRGFYKYGHENMKPACRRRLGIPISIPRRES